MKTRISYFIAAALGLAGLSSCLGDVRPPEGKTSIITNGAERIVEVGGGSFDLRIESDRPWEIFAIDDPAADWLTFSELSGPAGKSTISVEVSPNDPTADARVGKFQLHSGADGMVLTVIQKGYPSVSTSPADPGYIDDQIASVGGTWSYSYIGDIEEVGVMYRKAGTDPWLYATYTGELTAPGAFMVELTGLTPSTTYEYKAYIRTERDEVEGSMEEFTTYALAQPISVSGIRAMYDGHTTSVSGGYKIDCIVLSDPAGANTFGVTSLFVADASAPSEPGNGLYILIDGETSFAKGDRLDVKVTAAPLGILSPVTPVLAVRVAAPKAVKTGTADVEPVVINSSQLSLYESQLVKIDDVQLAPAFSDQTTYPTWYSETYTEALKMQQNGQDASFGIIVHPEAVFAAEATASGSGSLAGISAREELGIAGVMPRTVTDIDLAGGRFTSELPLQALSVAPAFNMVKDVALSNYNLVVYYTNGVKGVPFTGSFSVSYEGASAGLDAWSATSITPEKDGYNTLVIPITGTPTSSGELTFVLNGFGLTGDDAERTVTVFDAVPTTGNVTVVWNIPDTRTGANPSAEEPVRNLGDLAVNTSATTLNGTTATPFSMTGFYNGGNWNGAWGGSILAGTTPSNPLTYMSIKVSAPADKKMSLVNLSGRIRTNNKSGKKFYVLYSVDGAPFQSRLFDTAAAANSNLTRSTDLFLIPDLLDIPAGSTVEIRLLAESDPEAVGNVWAISSGGDAMTLVANVE